MMRHDFSVVKAAETFVLSKVSQKKLCERRVLSYQAQRYLGISSHLPDHILASLRGKVFHSPISHLGLDLRSMENFQNTA
jgi:hypothetical protein